MASTQNESREIIFPLPCKSCLDKMANGVAGGGRLGVHICTHLPPPFAGKCVAFIVEGEGGALQGWAMNGPLTITEAQEYLNNVLDQARVALQLRDGGAQES